jgi:hypothetical protein
MNYLSPACAKEEGKLQALEYRDIRLKPKLAMVCSEERAVYCKVGCYGFGWVQRRPACV